MSITSRRTLWQTYLNIFRYNPAWVGVLITLGVVALSPLILLSYFGLLIYVMATGR